MVKRTLECVGGVTLPETDAKPISGGEPPPSQPPFEPQAFAPNVALVEILSPSLAISTIPFTPDVFYIFVCTRTFTPPPFLLTKLT